MKGLRKLGIKYDYVQPPASHFRPTGIPNYSRLSAGDAAFRQDKAGFIGPWGHTYPRELVLWKWSLCQGLLFQAVVAANG